MISALVLGSDEGSGDHESREIIVRSLAWLVPAVVAGVVRDVIIAVPTRLDLAEIADRVGCEVVHADTEAERLHGGANQARSSRVLVVKAGYRPADQLIQEIDTRGGLSVREAAVMLAEPSTFIERLMPSLAPIVGVLTSKDGVLEATSFAELARTARRGVRFSARAKPL